MSTDKSVAEFEAEKRRRMAELSVLVEGGEVDDGVLSVLDLINGLDGFFTLSSCAGRMQVISVPEIGDKRNSVVWGKWHRAPGFEDVLSAAGRYEAEGRDGLLFLLVQSPIFHVACFGLEKGKRLRDLAVGAGFKYSSLKSVRGERVVVEVLGADRMDVPLGRDGRLAVDSEQLRFFYDVGCMVLERGKRHLERFKRELEVWRGGG